MGMMHVNVRTTAIAMMRASRTGTQSEARLDPTVFFRVSRSHIVNLRFIEAMAPAVDDSYTVRLRGGQLVPVSRRQSRRLRDTLSL